MSNLDSPFATLWIDNSSSIEEYLETLIDSDLKSKVNFFLEYGYIVIENAIPHHEIDTYLHDLQSIMAERDDLIVSLGTDFFKISELDVNTPLLKILDTHFLLQSARKLSFNAKITEFIKVLFQTQPLAFQTLHFEVGSTQAIHQDTAYVVVNEPLNLCASWIALEDIQPGSGELQYIPKSHRFPDFIYNSHFRHWNLSRDGNEIHNHHLYWLQDEAKKQGLETASFLPKKGDVLIWHADLAHGGAKILNPNLTRRSFVTHYTSSNCTPYYFKYLPVKNQIKKKTKSGEYYSSFYYK
jgi:phytanoyl-CoA hydroxylase